VFFGIIRAPAATPGPAFLRPSPGRTAFGELRGAPDVFPSDRSSAHPTKIGRGTKRAVVAPNPDVHVCADGRVATDSFRQRPRRTLPNSTGGSCAIQDAVAARALGCLDCVGDDGVNIQANRGVRGSHIPSVFFHGAPPLRRIGYGIKFGSLEPILR